jgi:hypothetical protein
MGQFGWLPVQVSEAKAHKNRQGYQQHLVRLRHADDLDRSSGEVADILLYNSHTGESSFRLMAGIYRFVCGNGLVVGQTVAEHRISHRGYADQHVANSVDAIMGQAPRLMDRINHYKTIHLLPLQEQALANAAANLRFDPERFIMQPQDLLRCRRGADAGGDLWRVFNRIQENLINGGTEVWNQETGKMRRSKRITSVAETIRLNQELWNLADAAALN